MKCVITLAILTTLTIEGGNGATMGDMFKLSSQQATGYDATGHCRSQGFDDLAVLNTPEEYNYVVQLTKPARGTVGVWMKVGGLYDAPSKPPYSGCAIMDRDGYITASWCGRSRQYVCGYLKKPYNEVRGTTYHAMMPNNIEVTMGVSRAAVSYTHCIVMCSSANVCRAAWFNSTSSICTLLKPWSYSSLQNQNGSSTFVREQFRRT